MKRGCIRHTRVETAARGVNESRVEESEQCWRQSEEEDKLEPGELAVGTEEDSNDSLLVWSWHGSRGLCGGFAKARSTNDKVWMEQEGCRAVWRIWVLAP